MTGETMSIDTEEPQSRVQARAVESLFQVFEEISEGAVSVDRSTRIVWINEKYRALLGIPDGVDVLGQPIEDVIPESLLREVVESGQPIILDIMQFADQHFVVSRLPLHDSAGDVIGAIGFVLYDKLDYLKPLISKFARLESKLSETEAQLAAERRTRYSIANIVGVSPQMVDIRRQARRMAQGSRPVLLLGETGTGKELLAQSIHAASDRADKPFVAINMAAIPENLLEAEFFGVAPGAFTGADRHGRQGKFEIADGGTLFLDEIAEMPIGLQAKLLRVLEEHCFEPVGSNEVRKVDVRIISATCQDLESGLAEGRFRQDLFYRLNVLQLGIPPLRERPYDVRALAEVLLESISRSDRSKSREIDAAGLQLLQRYAWPGNVRELRNVLERACMASDDDILSAELLREILPFDESETGGGDATLPLGALSLPQRIALLEQEAILESLRATGGKKAPAARLLGISRSTLYEKIEEHKLSDFNT